MFKILNRNREVVGLITSPINPVIEDNLVGMNELRFSVPASQEGLELEGYIRIENEHEYVIKEISTHGHNREVIAIMNVEELIGKVWTTFRSIDMYPTDCIREIVAGTGWTVVDNCPPNKRRNLYGTQISSWDLIFLACDVWGIEVKFDTHNKVITTQEKRGTDRGTYFMSDLNLKQLMHDSHTHKLITRVIPIGKDGLTIESVNGGKNYISNHSYSNKVITGIWQSDRYTKAEDLKEDATKYLEEMCIPYESYECNVSDLYRLEGNPNFEFNVGDVIYLIDNITKKKIQQRIIKHTKNLTSPDKDTINLANKSMSFTDYYKRLQLISNMTEQAIGSDGLISNGSIESVDADKIVGEIKANSLDVDTIISEHIKAEQILAGHIKANQIYGEHIVSDEIDTRHLKANSIQSDHISAGTIQSNHIQAGAIQSGHIDVGSVNAGHIQTGSITAGSGIIADGAIGSAQISSLDANKINAGEIDTSKVKIKGENGFLFIENNTLYVVDNNKKIRCELGVIENNSKSNTNYGFVVRGADGQTIMLDHNGVHNAGITDGAIDNRKVSENANISGKKLDIDSVIKTINEDGSVTIQGTKVQVGNTTLDVKLSEQNNLITEQGQRLDTQQSEITANTNAIKLKVDTQTYTADKNEINTKLNKATSDISVMKGQIALKVEQTDIENAVDELEGTVDQKIKDAKAEIKVTTDSISQRVSSNESTTSTLSTKVTTIEGTANTANSNATNALNKANTATTTANSASSNATSALNKANSAIEKADDAKDTADTAIETAEGANTTAGNALSTANTASQKVVAVEKEVTSTKSKVATLETNLDSITQRVSSNETTTSTLTTTIESVKTTANNANTNASNALDKANTASTNASNAVTTANKANTTASTASTNATTALNTANSAKDTASSASTKADNAVSTANTAKSTADKAQTTANSANTLANTANNTANTNKNNITTLQTTVTTTNNKVAELTTNLDGITQRVSSTESKLTTTTNKIDNLQIGGRNLIKNSNVFYLLGSDYPSVTKRENGKITVLNSGRFNAYGWVHNKFSTPIGELSSTVGKKFSMSVDIKTTNLKSDNVKVTFDFRGSGKTMSIGNVALDKSKNGVWYRVYTTFTTIDVNYPQCLFCITCDGVDGDYSGLVIEYKNWKLEEGNKATDWTPAPEDVDSSIASVDSKIATTNNKVASIETNLNGITQRVSSTESTVSSHTTQLGTVDSRINTAKNSAISTASSDATTKANNALASAKTDATTKANNALADAKTYTNGQITTVNKTINNKVAEIKATTDAITQRVSSTESTTSTLTTKVNTAQSTANTANSTANTNKSNLATLTTTVSNTNSKVAKLETNLSSITSRVSATETNLNTTTSLAKAMSGGKIVYNDPTFKQGTNNVNVYNNSANGTVTVTRISKVSDCPTTSTHCIEVKTTGTASPGNGGFYQSIQSRANAIFIQKILAKVPTGCNLNTASNSMGNGYSDRWLTSNKGTGKWEEYIREVRCGSTGTFSGGGHVYVSGASPTTSSPLIWYVGSCTVYDITDSDDRITNLQTRMSTAESKITESAITNTVKKNFYTKTETDSQITSKGYQTASQVQQTVDKLEVKFEESGGYNLIRNSAFKNGTDGWIPYANNASGTATMSVRNASASDDWVLNNRNSLEFSVTGLDSRYDRGINCGFTYLSVDCVPNKQYTFACLLSAHRVQTLYIEIHEISKVDNSTVKVHQTTCTPKSGGKNRNNWNRIYFPFTISNSNTNRFAVRVFMNNWNDASSNSVYLWMTEAMVTVGGEDLPYTPNTDELYAGITAIDKDGIKVTHSDGTYSKMGKDGFEWFNGQTGNKYHCLMYGGEYECSSQETRTVTLPAEFRGKPFKVISTIKRIRTIADIYVHQWPILTFHAITENINHANGTFNVYASVRALNYTKTNEGTWGALVGDGSQNSAAEDASDKGHIKTTVAFWAFV